ncbi:hypothetical protein [Sphingobacterium wenxiniae]|uniref:DNA alkylation repair enzyme n=1 Tax=Sphingobacterium wenxiniae TaxID=683125 RepID=A0A1I6QER3_9SPHI|nr:hypothetical protein [Sphingobacterium wenxiniae]SFS50957.1 hypothetical protein SAMN05660206_102307 [Sphingobacterium wenxiniae]
MENREKTILKFLKTDIRNHPTATFDIQLAQQYQIDMVDLLQYSYHNDKQIAFRAAWLLEHIILKEPTLLTEIYPTFIEKLPEQQNWSCQRSFTKILMLTTGKHTPIAHTEEQEIAIIENVFQWLITDACPVAIVVNCLDILNNLSDKHPWIKEELVAQINHLLKNPTPALNSRAKRILKVVL